MFHQRFTTLTTTLFIVALLCWTSVLAEKNDKKPTYKVKEHHTLLVPCNATQHEDIEIYWTENKTRSTFYQAGSNLMFTDITRFDSGDYICHAYNTSYPGENETNSNVTVEVVTVNVLFAAEIAGFSIYPTSINENQTFDVTSNIVGNPGPTWEIRNNNTGNSIVTVTNIAANTSLYGNHVRCGDTGWWEITGYNKLNNGVNVTRGVNLTVFCSPRPDPSVQYNTTASSHVGASAYFFVNVVGYPYPSYQWSRDDGKPMSHWIQTDSQTSSMLTLKNLTVDDFRTYILTMNNTMGSKSVPFQLTAYGRPERPYELRFTDVTYDSVRLLWRSGFDMGSREHFSVMKLVGNTFTQISGEAYSDYKNHGVDQEWSYTVNNLDSITQYNISVMAENDDGFVSLLAPIPVHFKTKVNPWLNRRHTHRNARIFIGSTVGGLVFLGLLAFIVYWKRYRHMRNSYNTMKGDTKT